MSCRGERWHSISRIVSKKVGWNDLFYTYIKYRKDVQVNLKKSYNDQKKESRPNETTLSGYEWYTTQAYRGKFFFFFFL
jgi:hypothetical protein